MVFALFLFCCRCEMVKSLSAAFICFDRIKINGWHPALDDDNDVASMLAESTNSKLMNNTSVKIEVKS